MIHQQDTSSNLKRGGTVYTAEFVWEFKFVGYGTNPVEDFEGSNVPTSKFAFLTKAYYTFPWW